MTPHPVSFSDKLAMFSDHFNPRIVAKLDGSDVRVAKIKGEFDWHHHGDADELFLVLKGRLRMDYRGGSRMVEEGELVVVPAGVEHRTAADEECHVMMIINEASLNTGENAPSALTRHELEVV